MTVSTSRTIFTDKAIVGGGGGFDAHPEVDILYFPVLGGPEVGLKGSGNP